MHSCGGGGGASWPFACPFQATSLSWLAEKSRAATGTADAPLQPYLIPRAPSELPASCIPSGSNAGQPVPSWAGGGERGEWEAAALAAVEEQSTGRVQGLQQTLLSRAIILAES